MDAGDVWFGLWVLFGSVESGWVVWVWLGRDA